MKKLLRWWWAAVVAVVAVPSVVLYRLVPTGEGWTDMWWWSFRASFEIGVRDSYNSTHTELRQREIRFGYGGVDCLYLNPRTKFTVNSATSMLISR